MPENTYVIKNKHNNHCWKLWHSSVITWDGIVVPCCFDKDAEHRMGKLEPASSGLNDDTGTFRSFWTNGEYREFRKSVLNSRANIEICKNCSEGTKV